MTTSHPEASQPAAPPAAKTAASSLDRHYDERRWRDTRALIRTDLDRLCRHLQRPDSFSHRVYFSLLPGFQALLWHRISRWCLLNDWRWAARLIALFAMYLTRAELPPTSQIGHSALIAHSTGVYIFGKVGARMIIQGSGGFGGGFGPEDIGGGPGYSVSGDDVNLAFGARVLGPVRVGNGVKVGPGALVTFDVPDGALVMWARPRVILDGAGPVTPSARPEEPPSGAA